MKKATVESVGSSVIRLMAISAVLVVSFAFVYEYNNPGAFRENLRDERSSNNVSDYRSDSYSYNEYESSDDPYVYPGMANDYIDRTDDTQEYYNDYSYYETPSYNVTSGHREVYVEGYTRSDGTPVRGHYRTAPNSTASDNWSSMGNINPHTGRLGTK